MIKFNVAQENYLLDKYPAKLSALLGDRRLENKDIDSREYLYVFQEVARAIARMYLSANRYFETLMLPYETPDRYQLDRIIHLNKAVGVALRYFETLRYDDDVKKAVAYLEEDEDTGERVVDTMPRDVPLSLAVVDPETSETELVTLILSDDDDHAVIIDEDGQEFTVPIDKIQSVELMDEVPDAIQNIDGMSVVSQSDMQPSADMEVMDEGAAEMDQAGQESPEDMDQEALSSEEGMGGMEGGEEMAAAEGGEEEVEKSKKRESASRSSKSAKTEDNFVQSFIRTFESAYAPKSTFGYALEEDVPFSIMKQGDKFAMGKLFDGEDPPTEYKEKMVDGLKETTFKGGYRSKLPEKPDESEVRKDTPGDKEAKATYKKSQQPIKSDSDIKYENRFSSHRSTRRVRPFKI